MEPTAKDIMELVTGGGGMLALGWLAAAVWRLVGKVDRYLDAAAADVPKVLAHRDAEERLLGGIHDALVPAPTLARARHQTH